MLDGSVFGICVLLVLRADFRSALPIQSGDLCVYGSALGPGCVSIPDCVRAALMEHPCALWRLVYLVSWLH